MVTAFASINIQILFESPIRWTRLFRRKFFWNCHGWLHMRTWH